MPLLSSPLTELKSRYDVVVIGSGYGGAIAASRLSRAKRPDGTSPSVCLLERGREIPVGQFPENEMEAAHEFQVNAYGEQMGPEDALYWLHAGEDISVFHGCGLGGTSLVNANVALPPAEDVWQDTSWPKELVADREKGLKAGFAKAEQMLSPKRYPGAHLLKYEALKRSAAGLNETANVFHPPINVTFESRLNEAGIHQPKCDGCGDCVSGCNVGAKNTLMMNYLPDAKNHGAELFCRVNVTHLVESGAGFRVHFRAVSDGIDGFAADASFADASFVDADIVIVSAGALGSTEIMLRSKQEGLPCSNRVGSSFSGNGDVLGFAYNTDTEINGVGWGKRERKNPAGPCITGIIDRRHLPEPHVIEEGSLPGAVAALLPEPMRLVAELTGQDTDDGLWDEIQERVREVRSALPGGQYTGAFRNTQTFLVMARDSADGQLFLEDEGSIQVSWPGVGESRHFKYLHEQLRLATEPLGGTYVPSPTFNKAFNYGLITVHPLGGCPMGDDAARGATNHKGQVFRSSSGTSVYESLYVSDGAVLPCSVGVNPLLTISAIAERNVRLLARDRGWTLDEELAKAPAKYDGKP
jgi:cholesterol oxidase